MIKVDILHLGGQANYDVPFGVLKKDLEEFLKQKNVDNVSVVVAVCDETEMKDLGEKYLGEKDKPPHNVLSFTESEVKGEFLSHPGKVKTLGEIAVCFPVAEREAKEMGVTTYERVKELVLHGALHLMGIHHK